MTTIAVGPQDIERVVAAVEHTRHEALSTAGWLATGGLARASLGVLSGHGLTTAALTTGLEVLAGRLALAGQQLGDDAGVARELGDRLIGSQSFAPTGPDSWVDVLLAGAELGDEAAKDGRWIARAAGYLWHGSYGEHARRWTDFGSYRRSFALTGGDALGLAGALVGGSAGGAIGDSGTLLTSSYQLGAVLRYGGKAVGKFSPLAAIGAGVDAYQLVTTDWQARTHGDAQGHDQATRNLVFGAKAAQTLGETAMAIAPFTGPAAPVVLGVGAAVTGVGAVVEGAVHVSDWLGEHPDVVRGAEHALTTTASAAWSALRHPTLPSLRL